MPFGVMRGVGRGMGLLDGVVIVEGGRDSFGGEFGASHSHRNQCGLCCVPGSCAKVREPIELSFGVVNGVGLGIRVLDGGGDAAFPKLLWNFLFCFIHVPRKRYIVRPYRPSHSVAVAALSLFLRVDVVLCRQPVVRQIFLAREPNAPMALFDASVGVCNGSIACMRASPPPAPRFRCDASPLYLPKPYTQRGRTVGCRPHNRVFFR